MLGSPTCFRTRLRNPRSAKSEGTSTILEDTRVPRVRARAEVVGQRRSVEELVSASENRIRKALDRAKSSGRARPLGTVEEDERSAEEDHVLQRMLALEHECNFDRS